MSVGSFTVGFLGHNGMIGSKLAAELTSLHQSGRLNLVVLHRASSDISMVADDIETRVIDLEAEDGSAYDTAIAGIQILISATASSANNLQLNLLPALHRSAICGTLRTFIPSNYGHCWSEDELSTMTNKIIKDKEVNEAKIREAGVPVTTVKSGLISHFAFQFPIGQWNPKGNRVFVYRDSQNCEMPLTTSTYLAKAVAQLIQQPVEYIVNRTFVAIEYEPTNAEITELLTTIHGEDTQLVKWDDDMVRQGCMAGDPIVSLGSAVLRKAGMGWWKFSGTERVEPIGWQTEGVEVQLRKQIEA